MHTQSFKRSQLPFSGKLIETFSEHQESLQPLIGLPFSAENFKKQIALKSNFSKESRETIHEALQKQYIEAQIKAPEKLALLLEDNCFTICTGHQLNLFTGPLYTIYKIAQYRYKLFVYARLIVFPSEFAVFGFWSNGSKNIS